MNKAVAVVSAALLAMLGACATAPTNSSVAYAPGGLGMPDNQTVQAPLTNPPIVPADKVKVLVYQEPDLSGDYVVDGSGRVNLPLVGQIEIQGRTASEASDLIRSRLAQTYLRDPKVSVVVSQAAQRTITVEGAVGQSGVFPIEGQTTLIRAVAMARGTTQDAHLSRVIVFRTQKGQRTAAAFDLKAIRAAESPDPEIYGNDVIVVTGSRAVWRDVLAAIPILGVFTAL